ncbi:MAG: hypothetical protein H7Z17_13305 [Fuerstia sp.]|nr:hypothetical protein [Fuerstiella sp.]
MQSPRIAIIVLFLPWIIQSESHGADKTEQNLIRATENYENAMEKYRKAVSAALDQAEVKARQAGPDQVAAVDDQRKLFDKFGCTPALCNSSLWSQRAAAHERMVKACQIALRDYTRAKEDTKAEEVRDKLINYWPAFLDDPSVGGWKPFGSPRMEVQDGIVTLTASRGLSGLITKRDDLSSATLDFELAGSYDVNAWLGAQITQTKGQPIGVTCQIRAEGGGVKAGFWSVKYELEEDDGRKFLAVPHEFFTESIRCFHSEFVVQVWVNDKMTDNVGGQTHLQYPGATAILVEKGVLVIRSASQKGVAK